MRTKGKAVSKVTFTIDDGLRTGYNVNVSDDQQPQFRSLSEFYVIIFVNKLNIVENTPPPSKKIKKNKNETLMAKVTGPF